MSDLSGIADDTHATIYYESHITIDPINDPQLLEKIIAEGKRHFFKIAKLYLKKKPDEQQEVSRYDDFFTTRGIYWGDIYHRTADFVLELQNMGVKVRRYKIEDTLLDIKL